tara:strand:+ start:1673 stop:1879 length:207 start_codon:yes stop_codon:yes gene_type:complete
MKNFKHLREAKKGMPEGEHVFAKKIGKVKVMIHKDKKGFTVYIDGDKLDTYRSQKEAESVGIAFAKEM